MHAGAYTSHNWVHNRIKWVTVKVSFLFYIDVASSKRNGTPGFMNVCSRNRPNREKLGEFHNLVKELYLPMETNLCCLSHSLRFFSTSSTPISFSFHDYTWKDGWKLVVDVIHKQWPDWPRDYYRWGSGQKIGLGAIPPIPIINQDLFVWVIVTAMVYSISYQLGVDPLPPPHKKRISHNCRGWINPTFSV